MNRGKISYTVNLCFEEIKLPPFQDILVVARNSKQGKIGLSKSFELLVPNGFQLIETEYSKVEAVFVNKKILAKISQEKVMAILYENVFPYISSGEIIKVDFKVSMTIKNIVVESP